jgi:hypothetical protein
MIRIASRTIGIAVACVCWNAGEVVARDIRISPLLDNLAMATGTYISQARACKTDEWKLALRDSVAQVRRRQPGSDLRYFQLVVEWANRYEALGCDQTTLLTIRQAQRTYLDRFVWDGDSGCKILPHSNFVC